ncbi:hypothetical protein [Clostridium thermobutyricum]|uniref:hypothetical protein n=1 Tax=Clostridium thermobutyricum TaxID=29372 RepID=UPI0018A8FF7B|nr:hypothetical protein [Clostridium thermobutyricum]
MENKIKRVNLRFNLDDPMDSVIWDFIKDEKKKGTFVKMALYNLAVGAKNELAITNDELTTVNSDLTDEDILFTEEELDDDGINF